jgi:hypothetical protein
VAFLLITPSFCKSAAVAVCMWSHHEALCFSPQRLQKLETKIQDWMCRLKMSCDDSWLNMTIGFAMIGWCDDWLGAKDPIPKMHFNAL